MKKLSEKEILNFLKRNPTFVHKILTEEELLKMGNRSFIEATRGNPLSRFDKKDLEAEIQKEINDRRRRFLKALGFGSLVGASALFGREFGIREAIAQTPSIIVKPESFVETVSHVFFKDETEIKAKSGDTGQIEFSGKDAATVINDVLANGLTGGRTWKEKVVSKGNFTISSVIKIPSYTVLEIQGSLTLANGVNTDILQNSDQTNGNTQIEIIGGELDGNKANQTAGTALIDFVKVTDSLVEGVYVHDAYFRGVQFLTDSHRNKVVNCWIENIGAVDDSGDGILLDGNDNIASGNYIKGSEGYNIYVRTGERNFILKNICDGASGVTYINIGVSEYASPETIVIGNTAVNAKNDGIIISFNSTDSLILGNLAKGNGRHGIFVSGNTEQGINLDTAEEIIIIGNEVRSNVGNGIRLLKSNFVTIQGNFVTENNYVGINITGSSWNIIKGNIVKNNSKDSAGTYFGIGFYNYGEAYSFDNIVIGNICTDDQETKTQGYGIKETGNTDRTIIIGNNVRGNLTGAILTVGANTIVERNIGYVTENGGTATIPNGSSSVVVDHGLAVAPSVVKLTGTHSEVANCWVTNVTSTQFTINAPAAVTADRDVYWQAEV